MAATPMPSLSEGPIKGAFPANGHGMTATCHGPGPRAWPVGVNGMPPLHWGTRARTGAHADGPTHTRAHPPPRPHAHATRTPPPRHAHAHNSCEAGALARLFVAPVSLLPPFDFVHLPDLHICWRTLALWMGGGQRYPFVLPQRDPDCGLSALLLRCRVRRPLFTGPSATLCLHCPRVHPHKCGGGRAAPPALLRACQRASEGPMLRRGGSCTIPRVMRQTQGYSSLAAGAEWARSVCPPRAYRLPPYQ